MVRNREPNLYDLEDQNLRRHKEYNPLFDILVDDFGNALKSSQINDDYVVQNYYIDERDDENITSDTILCHFPSGLKKITNSACLTKEISDNIGFVYLLIGKKGIGKTTLLKYYNQKVLNTIEKDEKCKIISVYLDLRNKWDDEEFKENLPKSLINEIFDYIRKSKKMPAISRYLIEPTFARELDKAYEILPPDRLVERILNNKAEAIDFLFSYLISHQYELLIIVDNIDDFGVKSVRKIINKCREMKEKYRTVCLVAVRDYWTPRDLEIDDSQLCSLHLSKPNIKQIIKIRLNSINTSSVTDSLGLTYDNRPLVLTGKDIVDTFGKIVDDLMASNKLQDELFKLTNYNVREFLDNLYYFFHSPYLFSRPNFIEALLNKIKEIDSNLFIEKQRPSMFFDYLEGFMTAHALCYDIHESKIFNLFHHEWDYGDYDYKNTLTFIRILQILSEKINTTEKQSIIDDLHEIGYYDERAIKNAITKLLKEALLESPDGSDFEDSQNIKVSPKGQLYLNRLIYEYTYILYICDAVPMPKEYRVNIYQKFGNEKIPLLRGDLALKHQSVRLFMRFIETEEESEERIARKKGSLSALSKIRGRPSKISTKMKADIEFSIHKMNIVGNRKVKKITSIRKIKTS